MKAVESQYHTIFQNYAKKSTLGLSFVLRIGLVEIPMCLSLNAIDLDKIEKYIQYISNFITELLKNVKNRWLHR